jgi:hypothetical protein
MARSFDYKRSVPGATQCLPFRDYFVNRTEAEESVYNDPTAN